MEENNKTSFTKHIFVCTKCTNDNHCDDLNYASDLRMELKSRVKTEFNTKDIRVNAAGCLGVCNEGIHAVIYPENKWFKKLSKESIEDLISHLKSSP